MMHQRGQEYHGMLRLGCIRHSVNFPEQIRSLSHLRVLSLSAGYAHCMAITDSGHLYGAGNT